MENKILSSKDLLDMILSSESKKIVGRVCKRIELLQINKEDSLETINQKIELTKQNIKELLYEFTRDLKDIFTVGNLTTQTVLFEIQKKSKGESNGK